QRETCQVSYSLIRRLQTENLGIACSCIERRGSDRRRAAEASPVHMRPILALIVCVPLLAACFITPHKIDVQQGNYLDQDMVAKLKFDMTRSQVRFILGSPLLTDPFHP